MYLAELKRLLAFMSSPDRAAVLKMYEEKFSQSDDDEALIRSLGTPTKVAFSLAQGYVPNSYASQMPEDTVIAAAAPDDSDTAPTPGKDSIGADDFDPEFFAQTRQQAKPQKKSGGKTALCVLLAIVIGLPLTAVIVALGAVFMALGAAAVGGCVMGIVQGLPILRLMSDILMSLGGLVILGAVGILPLWLGLWLIITLEKLLIKALAKLFGKLCGEKEVPEA